MKTDELCETVRWYRAEAKKWAAQCGRPFNSGFVFFWHRGAVGWASELTPSKWRPGVIAVGFNGVVLEAMGGSDGAGAENFFPL